MRASTPQVPYGAVYFRKSNPPREDWERDYETAAEDGFNIFRHWFLWGAIETAPDHFDFDDYDVQLELAERSGIQTIIAEMITSVPEWVYATLPELLVVNRDGSRPESGMSGSCATGGVGGVCLDNPAARALAGRFLTQLAARYKGHPALLGYDIWNEVNYSHDHCYCPHTARVFRHWLEEKYGDLDVLNLAWGRYSYTSWDQIQIPRSLGPYRQSLDWLEFQRLSAYNQMKWRAELIRKVDHDCLIAAHGIAATVDCINIGRRGTDDWDAASHVEIYGLTWVQSRKGNQPWKQWHAVDLTRSASRGKSFWHAEAQGGPLWMQSQVVGRPAQDGRVTTPENIRIWNMTTFAGGGRGLLYPRWRPLLGGPLWGAFGPYGMDGGRTDRSQMASRIARWANDSRNKALLEGQPVRGEIGILHVPEAKDFSHLQSIQGQFDLYPEALIGAYRGFFDLGVQADWIQVEDLGDYSVVLAPYLLLLSDATAEKISRWVAGGGHLICQACPAYFRETGFADARQPGCGFQELLGVEEAVVEFMPDILEHVPIETQQWGTILGAGFRQGYSVTTGTTLGKYSDGMAAMVENRSGKGASLVVGTFPSVEYNRFGGLEAGEFFGRSLKWAGLKPRVAVDNRAVTVRLHESGGRRFLWALNPTRETQKALLTVDSQAPKVLDCRWDGGDFSETADGLSIQMSPEDALVWEIG